ncbi:unnamed protein product [Ixodes hexagonus]
MPWGDPRGSGRTSRTRKYCGGREPLGSMFPTRGGCTGRSQPSSPSPVRKFHTRPSTAETRTRNWTGRSC